MTNKVDILQRIISEQGSCDWADQQSCANCPLGQLKTRQGGSYTNCIEAVGVKGLSETEADAKYKEAALNALLDIQIESTLEE